MYSTNGNRDKSQAHTAATSNAVTTKKDHSNDPQLVINVTYTHYEVIEDVAEELNMRTTTDEEEDWDIWFIDGPIIPALLIRMKNY